MRVFTALFPDAAVNREIDALVAARLDPAVWRAVDPARRHVTLCFHGEVDPAAVPRPEPAPAPRLRCAGAGVFGDALWLGIDTADPARLAALVAGAGGDPDSHVAHLTVARRRRTADRSMPAPPALAAHRGRWWVPSEVAVVASRPGDRTRPYRVLDRVVLG